MKKAISIILVIAMLMGLAACGAPKIPAPDDMIKTFCEAMKNFDVDTMQSLSLSKSDDLDMDDTDMDDAEIQMIMDLCKKLAKDITYTIQSSEVTDKTAKVLVDFKFKDGGNFIGDVFSEFLMQALTAAFGGADEAELESMFSDILTEKSESTEFKEIGMVVAFPCTLQEDNTWKINEIPEDVANIMTANILKALDELTDSMGEGLDDDYSGYGESSAFASAEYVLSDEVLADTDEFTVTLQSIEYDGLWGTDFSILCENKSADKTYEFEIKDVVVNGYSIGTWFSTDAAAGKKATQAMNLSDDTLELCGIDSIDEVRLTLEVADSDLWYEDPMFSESMVIYPTGKTAADIPATVRRTAEGEHVLADTDEFTYVIIDTDIDDFWGYSFNIFAENKTDKAIYFGWNDISVNDFMCEPYCGVTLAPKSCTYLQATFSDYTIEGTGLTFDDFEKLEFTLNGRYDDDWESPDLINETFTIQLK